MRTFVFRHASFIAFLAVLALWEAACRVFAIAPFILPSPSAIWDAAQELSPAQWGENLAATLSVALTGFAVAIAIALPLAVAITRSRLLSRIAMPWLVVIQSTPIVAIAPVIVVTLGAGNLPRVVITALISLFPLVISTATGLAAVPPEYVELSRSLRAPVSTEYTQIRLPYAVPYIFSALRVSITLAVVGAVVAEFVAAERGLGYLVLFATSSFKMPLAFAALTVLVCSSLLLYACISWLQRRLWPWSVDEARA